MEAEKNEKNSVFGEKTETKGPQDPKNFRIESATQKDFDKYLKFLDQHFSCREPLTIALKVDQKEVTKFLGEQLSSWLSFGCSVCAIHVPTNELAGVLFTKVLTKDDKNTFAEESIKILSENHGKLVKVLHHLEGLCNIFEDSDIEKALEIAVVATNPKFSGNRLAYRLWEEGENLGMQNGCQVATTQATNIITQHICKKIGYEECASLDFSNIVISGIKIYVDPKDLGKNTSGKVFKRYLKDC